MGLGIRSLPNYTTHVSVQMIVCTCICKEKEKSDVIHFLMGVVVLGLNSLRSKELACREVANGITNLTIHSIVCVHLCKER